MKETSIQHLILFECNWQSHISQEAIGDAENREISFTIKQIKLEINNVIKKETCFLGSKRIVNVCTRKGSNAGSSGFTGRNDENGTLTCHINTDRKYQSYYLINHLCSEEN